MKLYFLSSILILWIYALLKTNKSFHMLQQNWYNTGNRYVKWLKTNLKKNIYLYELILLVLVLIPIKNNFFRKIEITIFSISLITFIYIFIKNKKKEQTKIRLNYTHRVKRMLMTLSLFYLLPFILIIAFFNTKLLFLYYSYYVILLILTPLLVLFANTINKPIEHQVFLFYKRQATKKLNNMKQLDVIGITGSYGKTSSKNILNDILNVKYNSFPSPKNFNTTYGLINTINNYLDKFNDLFIAEMGAFKRGEIKELCDLVHPKYGIITKIGTAHLESFGSEENIQKGKMELIESLPHDGVGILNIDDPMQVNYKIKNKCKIIWVGIDKKTKTKNKIQADVLASNIKLSPNGTTFDCIFKNDKNKYTFETRLLGEHNIYNILQALALGYYLNMSIPQLQLGVKKVAPIEHRLELKKMGDINIIDDAYNSNPVGSKMALEVLNMMPGKRIVVTPGMIELGSKQYELNKEFGKIMAKCCDEVILVGEKQTKPIYDGLINNKFKKDKIHIINDVKEAFVMIRKLHEKDTYVLLENDLPDIFNEE